MSTAGSTNLANIGFDDAATFPNNVAVIDLGAGALGSYDGFNIVVENFQGARSNIQLAVYIQPDVVTADQLSFGYNGVAATSGGDDDIYLVSPDYSEDPDGSATMTVTGGPGNDTFHLSSSYYNVFVTAFGGSGDDQVAGGNNDDTLHGDTWDDGSISPAGILTLDVPAAAEGDDRLFGQKGADKLYGDGGNDFLDGGPRGEGYLDVLTGGTGADAFMLNYTQESSTGTSFWSQYISTDLGTTALDEVKVILENAGKDALE
ncbi:MAG: hypothetical protein R3D25_23005, partial [Geminicoccaceae bacterium]